MKITQEKFNEIYNQGINHSELSLTESDIPTGDLLDSAIIKMFRLGMTSKEILDHIQNVVNEISEDIIEGSIEV